MKAITPEQKEKQRAYALKYYYLRKQAMSPEEWKEYMRQKAAAQKKYSDHNPEVLERKRKSALSYYYRVVKPRLDADPEYRRERNLVWKGSIERKRASLSPEAFKKFMQGRYDREKRRRMDPVQGKKIREQARLHAAKGKNADRKVYEDAYRALHPDKIVNDFFCGHTTFTVLPSDLVGERTEETKGVYHELHQCSRVTVYQRHAKNHRIYCFHETSPDDLGVRRGQEGESENPSVGPVRHQGRRTRKG